jgi:ParB family chromosome partitioning protein
MTARRSALGRGLGALINNTTTPETEPPAIPEPAPVAPASDESADSPGVELAVDLIDPNPEQPRRTFDPEHLERLAASILEHGVLQPVVVRRAGDRYELIVGERRWRASRAAGVETIPAVVADVAPQARLEIAIVENVQRHDLNPMELAYAYRALADAGATQDEIGRKVSMDRSSVANHLRLLELPREIQEDIEHGRITMGHAKALLQVSNPERRRHLRDRVVEQGLSVRAAEQLGRSIAGPTAARRKAKPTQAPDPSPELRGLLDELQRRYQTRVHLTGDSKKGKLEIEYFSGEDLERISRMLLGDL